MTREEQIKENASELGQKYFPNEHNIWARENIEAKYVSEACVRMAKHIEQELIEKACKWLEDWDRRTMFELSMIMGSNFIEDFRKAMEG